MSETVKIPERRTPPPYNAAKSAAKAGTSVFLTWASILITVAGALLVEPTFIAQLREAVGDNKTWLLVVAGLQAAFVFYRDKLKHDESVRVPPGAANEDSPWTPPMIDRKAFMREEYQAASRIHGRRATCPDAECKCVLPKRISRKPVAPAPTPGDVK